MGRQRLLATADPVQPPKFTAALLGVALVFVVALVASALYELNRSQREAQERAASEIDALARVFAEQTRRSLQTVDIMLRSVADAHHDGTLPPLDSQAMHHELATQRDQFSDVAAVFVTDGQGRRLSSSSSYPPPSGGVAGADLIHGLQAGPRDNAFVGEPAHRISNNQWVLPVARRLEGPGRRFDGVVGALLDASYFDNFYAAVHLERGTSVALLHDSGTLVSMFPPQGAQVGQPVPAYRDLRREDAASNPPPLVRGPTGALDRMAVARPVPGALETMMAIPGVGAASAAAPPEGNGGANVPPDRYVVEYRRGREDAARLLAEMVTRGLPVASFAPEPMDLEQAYLRAGIRQVE